MKKAYVILLAGFFVFNIQAQNQEHKEFFDNGILEVEGFKDEKGANTGTWKYYHGTGQLAKIGNYLEGNETGEWKYYHFEPSLVSYGPDSDEWKNYHNNGVLLDEIGSFANGQEIGEWKFYHRNEELKEIRNYLNDKQSEYKEYDKNGDLKGSGIYMDGNVKATGPYDKKGNKTGTWKTYHRIYVGGAYNSYDWELLGTIEYINGKLFNGERKKEEEDGYVSTVSNYTDGIKTEEKIYYEGKLEAHRFLSSGLIEQSD